MRSIAVLNECRLVRFLIKNSLKYQQRFSNNAAGVMITYLSKDLTADPAFTIRVLITSVHVLAPRA